MHGSRQGILACSSTRLSFLDDAVIPNRILEKVLVYMLEEKHVGFRENLYLGWESWADNIL